MDLENERFPQQGNDEQSTPAAPEESAEASYTEAFTAQSAPEQTEQPYTEPAYTEPSYTEPTYTEPTYTNPTYTEQSYTAPQAAPAPERKKKGHPVLRAIAICLVCILIGGAAGCGGGVIAWYALGNSSSGSSSGNDSGSAQTTYLVESARTTAVETVSVEAGEEMTAAQIYAAYVNSCVGITVNITYNAWGYTTTSAASGSGFIVTSDGYIVTNYHVVEDGDSDGITVTLYNGSSYAATLIGYDEDNDVAVLKIEADEELTPVVLGDSDALAVGETVVAIGNPLGELTFSLTQGVVSALNRAVTLSSGTMNLIQTDCAINSGNSGGPLFNAYGEVIGITNAKYSTSSSSEASIDNIGFAIPINTVKSIIESVIENGYVVKPYLGISIVTVDETTAAMYNLQVGAYVRSVDSGSCAEAAGMQAGDTIIACDGETVTTSDEVVAAKNAHAAGDEMTITVVRNGEEITLTVVLDAQIQSATTDSSSSSSSDSGSGSGSGSGGGFPGNNRN